MRRREFIGGLGAAAWPCAARAQQALPVIGYFGASVPGEGATLAAFRKGLSEIGYFEGRNVAIEYRWAQNRQDQLRAQSADLVSCRVAVIVAVGGPASAVAAKSATATTPIIFANGSDPIALGLVESLNRPSGNVTGVSFLTATLAPKRLELLHEAVPTASSIAYLVNSTNPTATATTREAQMAARILGVRLVIMDAGTPSEIEAAFARLVEQRIGAIAIDAEALFTSRRDQLAALAARHAAPAMYAFRQFVEAGGLMSYGASLFDAYRLAGTYAGRILKGEKPADLPVMQPTKFEFVINLKTAKTLGDGPSGASGS